MFLILMIAIGLIVLAIILTTIIISRKHQIQPSYFSFFIIGITWLPLGLVLKNYFFAIMGTAFLVAGLANHKKWQTRIKWSELPEPVKRLRIFIMIFLIVLVLVGFVFFLLANNFFVKF
jgi:hypothetical protein